MHRTRVRFTVLSAGLFAITLVAGCVPNDPAGGEAIQVVSTESTCEVATDTAPSGAVTFDVQNEGTQVTEFYLLGDDGLEVIGEVEDVAPGASRSMTVTVETGEYITLCKPGMTGDGVGRATFTVTGE